MARSQVSGHEFTHAVGRKEKSNSLLKQNVAERNEATFKDIKKEAGGATTKRQ
jgi:hypothetical protein